ncbi:hypothetical protein CEXT_647541 [Caerostris extrusa]|uniref:Uncharacterized protein n=1 Tax=Caerostris extrusa TaxID=172846 RepID=A0AAV4XKB2_CAEEX|nr:hypothetical protein CEXT_647541 [Caerostris extrusa]
MHRLTNDEGLRWKAAEHSIHPGMVKSPSRMECLKKSQAECATCAGGCANWRPSCVLLPALHHGRLRSWMRSTSCSCCNIDKTRKLSDEPGLVVVASIWSTKDMLPCFHYSKWAVVTDAFGLFALSCNIDKTRKLSDEPGLVVVDSIWSSKDILPCFHYSKWVVVTDAFGLFALSCNIDKTRKLSDEPGLVVVDSIWSSKDMLPCFHYSK